jgi:signal transduction histidine kinase
MFDSELFASKNTYNFHCLDNSSMTLPDDFVNCENRDQADFFIKDNKISFDNVDFINWNFDDSDDLRSLIEIRRTYLRVNNLEIIKLEELDGNEAKLFWRIVNLCVETPIDNCCKKLLNLIFKDNEIKKYFDFEVIPLEECGAKALDEDLVLYFKDYVVLLNYVEEDNKMAQVCAMAISSYLHFISDLDIDETQDLSINEFLSSIDYPLLVLNNKGEVSSHNEHFTSLKILPSSVFEQAASGWITKDNVKYKIMKQEIDSLRDLYILVEQSCKKSSLNSNESDLGIISGSIAHELNNPVGGILAALTLLELEDWDEDTIKTLSEMKASALRSKALIETFLGFSKYDNTRNIQVSLETVVEQSTSLMRYRMIESGLFLEIDIDEALREVTADSSILTMVFYLIFSELITLYSHKRLINKELPKQINVSLKSSRHNLDIKVRDVMFNADDINALSNKLVRYLLQMNGVNLNVSKDEIVLENFKK